VRDRSSGEEDEVRARDLSGVSDVGRIRGGRGLDELDARDLGGSARERLMYLLRGARKHRGGVIDADQAQTRWGRGGEDIEEHAPGASAEIENDELILIKRLVVVKCLLDVPSKDGGVLGGGPEQLLDPEVIELGVGCVGIGIGATVCCVLLRVVHGAEMMASLGASSCYGIS
jgi:hypothetical protein